MKYNDLFTVRYPVVDGERLANGEPFIFEHSDGSVSCALRWPGIDYESTGNEADLSSKMRAVYSFYIAASQYQNLYIENHYFRGLDGSYADEFYNYGERNFKEDRNPELAKTIRRELADHFKKYSRHNDVYQVLTLVPSVGFFSRTKASLEKRKKHFVGIVKELITHLPNVEILSVDDFWSLILRHNNPAKIPNGKVRTSYNYRFHANEMLSMPSISNGCVRTIAVDGSPLYSRVIVLIDYPDALQDWQVRLSRDNSHTLHVVQITKALDTQIVTQQSAHEAHKSQEAANMLGGESVAAKVRDLADHRHFVQEHNLTIHNNCFVIVVTETSPELAEYHHRELVRWLNSSSETLLHTNDIDSELAFFRISTPGQGHRTSFMRADHHWQVGNMMPCFAQGHGDMQKPEMAYLTQAGTLVGMSYETGGVHHGICAAKTGSGKSVAQAAKIAQLYPLGKNFYVIEVGRSYEYLIRAYGGEYHVLDADRDVISPFSSYSEVASSINSDEEFSATVISTMRKAIMPLMTGRTAAGEDDAHYKSMLDDVIRAMYLPEFIDDSLDCPTLLTFLNVGEELLSIVQDSDADDADHRAPYLKSMLDNLRSFLSTAEGSVFKRASTIDFTAPLIGVDFGELIRGEATDTAKYLLLFVVTRLQQLSFTRPEQCFLILDEDHEYTAIDKPLMQLKKSQITKRGRKSSAFLYAISQVVEDIAFSDSGEINSGFINQMNEICLMYYGTEHGRLPDVFRLPARAAQIWTQYPNPLEPGLSFNYRQAMLVRGQSFYDLFLTWPDILNAITNSNPDAISLKDRLLTEEGGDAVLAIYRFLEEYRK